MLGDLVIAGTNVLVGNVVVCSRDVSGAGAVVSIVDGVIAVVVVEISVVVEFEHETRIISIVAAENMSFVRIADISDSPF